MLNPLCAEFKAPLSYTFSHYFQCKTFYFSNEIFYKLKRLKHTQSEVPAVRKICHPSSEYFGYVQDDLSARIGRKLMFVVLSSKNLTASCRTTTCFMKKAMTKLAFTELIKAFS